MKRIIILTILLSVMILNAVISFGNFFSALNPDFFYTGQSPFSFTTIIPSKIKISDKVDLSFIVNQSIVFQYRLKLEVPKGGENVIDKSLLTWSGWINKDINQIIIPKLGKEGRYKLLVEYKTHTSSEIKIYEKLFEVFNERPEKPYIAAQSKIGNVQENTSAKSTSSIVEDKTPKTPQLPEITDRETKTENAIQTDTKQIEPEKEMDPANVKQDENPVESIPDKPVITKKETIKDYDLLLRESIENKNVELLQESVEHGANLNLKGINGGNIFHLLDENSATERLISTLKSKGVSINESDNYGNTPLLYAILSGKSEYAKLLINQGSNLELLNNQNLSPLHLAVFMNNKDLVEDLISKGTNVNLKGNTGYTPLHIATEMNHLEIARDLLKKGAKEKIKTDQKLTCEIIAKIQKNKDMIRLIASKGSGKFSQPASDIKSGLLNSGTNYPKIDFNLPYDKVLIKKRQTARIIRIVSVPLFAVTTVGAVYFRKEADNYYKLHKSAETQESSNYYYNKTTQNDTYGYISGGVSLVSLYGFIHSTIWKKNVTKGMSKTF